MIYGNTSSFRDLAIHLVYWVSAVFFFTLVRFWHGAFIEDETALEHLGHTLQLALSYGLIIGLLVYVMKSFIGYDRFKNLSYGKMVIYRNFSYIGLFAFIFALRTFIANSNVFGVANTELFKIEFFSASMIISLLAMLFFAGLFDLFAQIALKIGKNNFWKMLTGRYHSPKEEEKIFMFLDLQSSTTIAEQLGHKKYSEFIQECFKDISVIGEFGGEVYQYVGDEAVFTWDARKKGNNRNSIEAFYAFQDRIKEREEFYKDKFGTVPLFKAGLHGGEVMVAEVGLLKKEIAFHGDTINTAARIQQLCNEKGKIFLTSEYFRSDLETSERFAWEDMGDILLKGRHTVTKLYHPALVG